MTEPVLTYKSRQYAVHVDINSPEVKDKILGMLAKYNDYHRMYVNKKPLKSKSLHYIHSPYDFKSSKAVKEWLERMKKLHNDKDPCYCVESKGNHSKDHMFIIDTYELVPPLHSDIIENTKKMIKLFDSVRKTHHTNKLVVTSPEVGQLIPPDEEQFMYACHWEIRPPKVFLPLSSFEQILRLDDLYDTAVKIARNEHFPRQSKFPQYYITEKGVHVVASVFESPNRDYNKVLPDPIDENIDEINKEMDQWLSELRKIKNPLGAGAHLGKTHYQLFIEHFGDNPLDPFDYAKYRKYRDSKNVTRIYEKHFSENIEDLLPLKYKYLNAFVTWNIYDPTYRDFIDRFIYELVEDHHKELNLYKPNTN